MDNAGGTMQQNHQHLINMMTNDEDLADNEKFQQINHNHPTILNPYDFQFPVLIFIFS